MLRAVSLLCFCVCVGPITQADTFEVTNTDNSGVGSLRWAILEADKLGGPHTITISATGTVNLTDALPVINRQQSNEISIEGPGAADLTVDGGGTSRAMFVNQGDVTIKGITIANGNASGGDGTDGGGGGLGAGGGLFVNSGANVVVEEVEFENNSATGGIGGASSTGNGGGGGGGLGGNGGSAAGGLDNGGGGGGGFAGDGGNGAQGGGGGGGLQENGSDSISSAGGAGATVGGGNGGSTNTAGADGTTFGGGGGAGEDLANDKSGGNGGDFGGGGGGEGQGNGGTGGNGGFGGAGAAGGNLATGGAGGFGAGGGAGGTNGTGGAAGTLGGAGGAGGTGPGAGGGGAGLGGAVFVRSGGSLIIRNSGINGSAVTAGAGGVSASGTDGTAGQMAGQDLFLNGTVGQVDVTTGTSTMTGSISGTGSLTKSGDGDLVLSGANNYSGGTLVAGGNLQGDTNSLQGDISNNATLTFDQGFDATFGNVISGTGDLTKLGTGVLTLSEANTYSGGTTITAGTLQGNTTSLQGDIVNNASLVFDQNIDGSYIGVISGTGGLTKQGTGIITLTGQNLFTGGTSLLAGGLSVASDDLLGDLSGGLTFDGGTLITTGSFTTARETTLNSGGGTIDTLANDIEQTGTITGSGQLRKSGDGTLTLSAANTYTGGTAINSGTVIVAADNHLGDSSGGVSLDSGTLLTSASFGSNRGFTLNAGGGTINTLDHSLVFSGQFSGAGDLTKLGTGKLTLAGTSNYTGQTNINDGLLTVNGTIDSNVIVNSGGTLGGTGSVGGLTVNSGGTVAPGNSIGTTAVNGDYTHEAGANYDVEIDVSNNDRIDVTGSTTINGGDVRVTSAPGDYINGSTYTILTSGSGVSGEFDSVSDDLALFQASLIYNSNDIVLLLNRAATNFTADADSWNQTAVATLLDEQSLTAEGDFANLLQEIYGLSKTDQHRAFDALSGNVHGSTGIATILNAGSFLNSLNNSIGQSNYGGIGDDTVVRAQSSSSAYTGRLGTTGWIRALGQNGSIDGANGIDGLDYGVSGQAVGIERTFSDWAMLGGSIYTSQLHTSADQSNSHVDSNRVALYGRSSGDVLQIFGAVSFGNHSFDSTRHVVIGGMDRAAKGTYDGQEFATYWELSAPINTGSVILEPLIGLQVVTLTQDDFRETGADSMNLIVNEANTTSIRPSLGARALLPSFQLGAAQLLGEIRGRYMYEGGDTSGNVTAGFNNGNTGTFSIQGADVGQHFGMFGSSVTAQLSSRTSVFLAYDGLISSASSAHAGNLGLTFIW